MAKIFKTKFNPSTDLPDLAGKVIIVTGGTAGIGYSTIKHLARRGAKVYMAARSKSRAKEATERLIADGLTPGNGEIKFLQLDMRDPRNAKVAAEEFLAKENRLDVLVSNAAVHTLAYEITSDDVLNMALVNYISPWVLTELLLPVMRKTAQEPSADVRIVNVSWERHRNVPDDTRFKTLNDFNREFKDAPNPDYARCSLTKLEGILWINELQKRLDAEGAPIIAVSVEPGHVNTYGHRLTGAFAFVERTRMRLFFKGLDEGAYNSVIAAASPEIRKEAETYRGAYLEGDGAKITEPSKLAQDEGLAKDLWATTESFVRSIGLN